MKLSTGLALFGLMVAACAPGYQAVPVGPAEPPTGGTINIGTWNLEWLHDDHERGFPEYFSGGPTYGPREASDYRALADIITGELDAAILILNEVNAKDEGGWVSHELKRLTDYVGPDYQFVISEAGDEQHTAIMWNRLRARLDTTFEIAYPEVRVQSKDIFARDPLAARFTLLEAGRPQNDLLVVALHLASGQSKNRNHDSALARLTDTLRALVLSPDGVLSGETDIVLAGDLNFDYFDDDREAFVELLEAGAWDVLADSAYPYTRLAGVPLVPASRLDYFVCTDAMRGERALIETSEARVHGDLARGGYDRFRRIYSDHFPVTVAVRIVPDDD